MKYDLEKSSISCYGENDKNCPFKLKQNIAVNINEKLP